MIDYQGRRCRLYIRVKGTMASQVVDVHIFGERLDRMKG